LGIRKNVTVDLGLDINKILLVGLLVFTLVGSMGLYLPENLAFAGSDEDDDEDKKDEENRQNNNQAYKAQIDENTAHLEAMSTDFDLFKGIAETLNSIMVKMDALMEDFKIRIAGVEGELQKEIEAREASEAALKAEIDSMKTNGATGKTGDIGLTTAGGGSVTTYTNTISVDIASDNSTSVSVSCELGDTAVSGGFTPISANFEDFLSIFRSELGGSDSWQLDGFNEDPTNILQIDVFVNCITTTSEEFTKASTEGSK